MKTVWICLLYITLGNGYSSHSVTPITVATRADCMRLATVHNSTGEGTARCVQVQVPR